MDSHFYNTGAALSGSVDDMTHLQTSKQFNIGSIHPQSSSYWLVKALAILAALSVPMAFAQDDNLRALDGDWVFVEDRTEGRAVEDGGAPYES